MSMGIYIKSQNLPKEGEHYLLQINSDGTVYDAVGRRIAAQAVPIPPHGRLIDADKFKDYIMYGYESNKDLFVIEKYRLEAEKVSIAFCKDIDEQETVIPAEEGE